MFGCYFFSDESGNGYKPEGAHLHWMNKLTTTGIIGLIVFLLIPYNFIRNNLRLFDPTYKFYYILASLSILGYGFIKQLGGRDTWYAFFVILPGLYYLPLLKIKNKVKDPGDMLSDLSKDESKKTIKNL
jgi:energy-coupling factor transporter transmembrane protein EcfT